MKDGGTKKTKMKHIYKIFKNNKIELLKIYFYMLFAEGLLLLEPFVLGKSIDGLLENSYKWLTLLIIIFVFSNIFMYKRMIYDTKVYSKIYNDIISGFIYKKNVDNSAKIARTDMANEIIDFLENYAHYYISTIITIFGSLYFIMYQNISVGLTVLLCAAPITFIAIKFYKKIKQATVVSNNHYEQKVDIINRENKVEIETFFNRRRRLLIQSSTLQGKHWVLISSVKYIFLLLAVVLLVKTSSDMTEGQIVSSFTYVRSFLISLMSIPVALEAYSRIRDILNRIN